ncbi:phage portal protein [Nocardioides oleivorans]|uniref:Phage portal protein n=1 Tax=Nocardioides oleivorans TaxID=273676 RepID=A0A4Q2RT53_9ACTN|nr:phage portal protein [Nocardioides oleivorans]RYB91005.1 phage portal protein [Nocardioides oleivorans]
MGWYKRLLTGSSPVTEFAASIPEQPPSFAVDAESIPAQIFGLESYADPIAQAPRIDRKSALQVPAVKGARDKICGPIGGLPLNLSGPDRRNSPWALFERPEPDRIPAYTIAMTVEDLLFEEVAWWRVLTRDWRGYPAKVRRLHPRSVTVAKNGKVYVSKGGLHSGSATEWVEDRDLIRFDSLNEGLLTAGARAIRTCLRLDSSAAKYAEGSPPVDWFESDDPIDDPQALVSDWATARRTNTTGFVPWGVRYKRDGWTPEQLQMAEARNHAVLEIARISGVDPEELGVSTTSRTYANQFDRRKAFLDFTLGPYLTAIEQTLSSPNVSPRGYRARFDLDAFLRSDPKGRYEAYRLGLDVGALTEEEIREAEDKPLDSLPPDPLPETAADTEEAASA